MKALKCLVYLNRGELSFLKKDVSVIDCNQAELLSKAELLDRINSKFKIKIIELHLSKELKEKIRKAILDSPLVRFFIKEALRNKVL